jgi:hypothetical protein
MFKVPETFAFAAGAVSETVGGVVSVGGAEPLFSYAPES